MDGGVEHEEKGEKFRAGEKVRRALRAMSTKADLT